jgi:AraC-like DNA-binding protein
VSRDILSDVLRSVHLRGAVFYHVEGCDRWVSEAPDAAAIARLIMPGADHVMAYVAVIHGRCWAQVCDEAPVGLVEGDVVVFPQGDAHVISSEPDARGQLAPSPFEPPRSAQLPFFASRQGNVVSMRPGDAPEADGHTTLVCGFCACDAAPFNPLLASLPHLLHVHADSSDHSDWITQFIRFALAESTDKRPGGEALLERLSETMFIELIRRYLGEVSESQRNWLAGLRDRHVGHALMLLHEHPANAWSIELLADQIGLSKSALHDRFNQFTGYGPMHYLAKWRMQVAAGLLRQSHATVGAVALEVGYESEAAFSRAFRRETGLPPATWRRLQEQRLER